MSAVDDERWRRAGALFNELVDLDPSSRSDRLAHVGSTDPELRAAVEALLRGDEIAEERLPTPGFGLPPLAGQAGADPLGLEGQTISRFRVLAHVASGGMGVVYRAEDLQLQRTVALKFPLPRGELSDTTRRRALREAKAAAALDHPNLCPIYEVGDSAAGPFFAMPLYHGETLRTRLARAGSLDVSEALAIVAQLTAGLECAHAAGVVHQDIKPGNVMLLPDGSVKLLDFGLARATAAEDSAPNTVFGTLHYMAPEQLRGEAVDGRADLWALGVMLYEMLSGRRPFGNEGASAVGDVVPGTAAPALRDSMPGVPTAVDELVRSLLQREPGARMQSAAELSRAIRSIVNPDHHAGGYAARPGLLRRGARVTIAAGVLLAAATVAGAEWLRPRPTLIGRGAISARDTLILADFQTAAADSALVAALTTIMRRELSDWADVSVLPAREVRAALQRMRRTPGERLTPELAREVARREGARAVVSGHLAPLGGGYLVTVRLVAAESGDELISLSATARTPEQELLPALAGLVQGLRRRVGESLRDAPGMVVPQRKLTTTSLTASRLVWNAGPPRSVAEAIAAEREALALDSTFAYAWMSIGNQLDWLGYRNRMQDSAFAMAYRLRDHLTLMERAQVTALYWRSVWRDRVRQRAAFEAALAQDTTVWLAVAMNLAGSLLETREIARAEAFIRRIGEWPSVGPYALIPLAQLHAAHGRFDAADSAVSRLGSQLGAENVTYLNTAWEIAVAAFRFDSAETLMARVAEHPSGPAMHALSARVQVLRLRGRLAEAHLAGDRLETAKMTIAAAADARFLPAIGRSLEAVMEDLWLRGHPAHALARLDSTRQMLSPPLEIQDRIDATRAAALYAAAGGVVQARALVAAAEQGADTLGKRAMHEVRQRALAEIALAEGRYSDATELFRLSDRGPDGLPASSCSVCVLPHLARVAERAGRSDSALVLWERYVTEPSINRLATDQWFLPMAYRRLALLHGERGDVALATGYRRKLSELWRKADANVTGVHLSNARERSW